VAEQGTDSSVQIQPESTGPKIDTVKYTINSAVVERQRVEVLQGPALNTYGENLAVISTTTVTLVTYAAPADWQFLGIIAGGEADALFTVKFGVTVAYRSRTNIAHRSGDIRLDAPDPAAGGVTVTIEVTNNGLSTGIFEATLLGQRAERVA